MTTPTNHTIPFESVVTAAGQLLTTLQAHWPDAEPMPLYPAFRE